MGLLKCFQCFRPGIRGIISFFLLLRYYPFVFCNNGSIIVILLDPLTGDCTLLCVCVLSFTHHVNYWNVVDDIFHNVTSRRNQQLRCLTSWYDDEHKHASRNCWGYGGAYRESTSSQDRSRKIVERTLPFSEREFLADWAIRDCLLAIKTVIAEYCISIITGSAAVPKAR